MSRDETVWNDPEAFRPERFLEMDSLDAKAKDPLNMVFGYGRRSVVLRPTTSMISYAHAYVGFARDACSPIQHYSSSLRIWQQLLTLERLSILRERKSLPRHPSIIHLSGWSGLLYADCSGYLTKHA